MLDKELEAEFSGLKEESIGVKTKSDDLINKYTRLENRYEKKLKKSRKINFKL